MLGRSHRLASLSLAAILHVPAVSPARAQESHGTRDVRPHASSQLTSFVHSSGSYALEHPADWRAHERGERTNIGSEDGLVPSERGFRTIYGTIVQVAADPLIGRPDRSAEASARLIVDQVLKRNPHQTIAEPVAEDRPLAGAQAFRAVLMGTSPVTGRGERAEIVVRQLDAQHVLYLVLVSPAEAYPSLEAPLRRLRDSVRIPVR